MSDTMEAPAPVGASAERKPLLSVRELEAWYGESHVLHGIAMDVYAGEVVTLIGRNGAGKTTALKAIMGVLNKRKGSVIFSGKETIQSPARTIARLGMGFCPEERAIFSTLTVRENLFLPPVVKSGGMDLDTIFELFPNLRERMDSWGTQLSGGEQQMLAIARILRTGSSLLLLDEPTEGLAPVIVQQIARTVELLKERGMTILLVEQNLHFASRIADRHYVLEEGGIVDAISGDDAAASRSRLQSYLGL